MTPQQLQQQILKANAALMDVYLGVDGDESSERQELMLKDQGAGAAWPGISCCLVRRIDHHPPWSGLDRLLSGEAESHQGAITLISPYIAEPCETHPSERSNSSNLDVMEGNERIANSSDLDLYPLCKERWHLYLLDNLHTKLYWFRPDRCWVGSANFTHSGLQDDGNVEVLSEHPMDAATVSAVESLFLRARLVDDVLHDAYSMWLAQQPPIPPVESTRFEPPVADGPFTLDAMPLTYSPSDLYDVLIHTESADEAEHAQAQQDLSALRLSFSEDRAVFFDGLRTRYFSHPLVRHLLEHLNEEWTRFGRLRALMSDACGGYEMVAEMRSFHTQNFYEWVEELDRSKNFEFGTPRHSQLIRRRYE